MGPEASPSPRPAGGTETGLILSGEGTDKKAVRVFVLEPDTKVWERNMQTSKRTARKVRPRLRKSLRKGFPVVVQDQHLPPIPAVAWKVLEVTSDVYWDSQRLEEIIAHDQALTGRVLRLANSAYFGVRGTVTTVGMAAVVVGHRRLRSIAVTASLEGVFHKTAFGASLWEHSLAVALASREIALHCTREDAEEAFVAGLLHDIGKMVFDLNDTQLYAEVLEEAQTLQLPVLEVERQRLQRDHLSMGSLLARKWNLPDHLEEVLRLHHFPEEATVRPRLCAVVNLADTLCLEEGLGPQFPLAASVEESPARLLLSLSRETLKQVRAEVAGQLEKERRFFRLP